MKLSIVIPVYNEKDTIRQILKRLDDLDLGMEKEIVIVDDFSSDGTRDIIKEFEEKHKVIYQEKNGGKGSALRKGFKHISGDVVVVQDADLEYDPGDLKLLLEKIKEPGTSVVYGSRRKDKNYFQARKSGHIFAIGGIFITWLTNLLYGTKLTDAPTCYKMFKSDLLKNIELECERFEFCPEVNAKIAKMEVEIKEVPISYFPRHKSEGKKINWKDGVETIWVLLKYKFKK